MPMYVLSTERHQSTVKHYVAYDRQVDSLNRTLPAAMQLHIVCAASNIHNPDPYLEHDSTSGIACWLRAICQAEQEKDDVPLMTAHLLDNLSQAIDLSPQNAYLYYDRGNAHVQCLDYQKAIDDYSRAIQLDANLAEAFYNRGLAHMALKHQEQAVSDLSKAGELGLYTAYSILKRQRK